MLAPSALLARRYVAAGHPPLPPPVSPRRLARWSRWAWLVEGARPVALRADAARASRGRAPAARGAARPRSRRHAPTRCCSAARSSTCSSREEGDRPCVTLARGPHPDGPLRALEIAFPRSIRHTEAAWRTHLARMAGVGLVEATGPAATPAPTNDADDAQSSSETAPSERTTAQARADPGRVALFRQAPGRAGGRRGSRARRRGPRRRRGCRAGRRRGSRARRSRRSGGRATGCPPRAAGPGRAPPRPGCAPRRRGRAGLRRSPGGPCGRGSRARSSAGRPSRRRRGRAAARSPCRSARGPRAAPRTTGTRARRSFSHLELDLLVRRCRRSTTAAGRAPGP